VTLNSPLSQVRAVLFDLDGTLLDSFRSHFRVYQSLFADLGIPFDDEMYVRYYSPNWYLLYERIGLPKGRWPEADRLWLHYYERETPSPRDGADQLLVTVQASGRALGLVTSGERSRVERDLDRVGWQLRFQAVVCGGDAPYRKPHPAPLLRGLDQLKIRPVDAAYVGDTMEDVRMGKSAGATTVAVAGGFSPKEILVEARPDLLLESLPELRSLLTGP
jgi:HAD superfamily hydrolase (TIGR01509 family)